MKGIVTSVHVESMGGMQGHCDFISVSVSVLDHVQCPSRVKYSLTLCPKDHQDHDAMHAGSELKLAQAY